MNKLHVLLALFGILLAAPFPFGSEAVMNIAIMTLYTALLGQAWNILGGYGGQFSFGHAAFFGVGAYTVAVLQVRYGINAWLGFAAGGVLAAAVGAFIGYSAFRYGLRGSYFALVTLAFAEVLRILSNSTELTGAGVGLLIPLDTGIMSFQFPSTAGFYVAIWTLALAASLVVWWLGRSRFGAQLTAVRDNEDAARALGVDPFRVKMAAIMLSAFFTGLAGAFYAQLFLYLDPSIAFGPAVSVEALLVPIVGGLGTLFGPIVGAIALRAVAEVTQHAAGSLPGLNLAVYGMLLVVMVLFLPRGIAGIGQALRPGWRRPSATETSEEAARRA